MLSNIIAQAEYTFGQVIQSKRAEAPGMFILLIKRDSCPFAGSPFMTIKANPQTDGSVSFYYGHYDLTQESADLNFSRRN